MSWNKIETNEEVKEFMKNINNFHDSCIKELSFSSGTYVDTDYSMIMNTNPTIHLIIERQSNEFSSVELLLQGVTKFHLNIDLDATLEIIEANFYKKENFFYWFSDVDDNTKKDEITWFSCKAVKWRERIDLLGDKYLFVEKNEL